MKGHGTGNDFVIIPDVDGRLDLTPDQVRWLCDRHRGIGADGVLRVVRTEHVPELADFAGVAEFFMDYRNADGTVAEMCGNGARLFVRYLDATGLVTDNDVVIATRGGLRSTTINSDRSITIDMGQATHASRPRPPARDGRRADLARHRRARAQSARRRLRRRPRRGRRPARAARGGARRRLPGRGQRRVRRRPRAPTTWRCGCTSAGSARRCRAAPVPARSRGRPVAERATTRRARPPGRSTSPGGTVHVTETAAGALLLSGPADLVARGTVLLPGCCSRPRRRRQSWLLPCRMASVVVAPRPICPATSDAGGGCHRSRCFHGSSGGRVPRDSGVRKE